VNVGNIMIVCGVAVVVFVAVVVAIVLEDRHDKDEEDDRVR
jgi:hypothetical protein